MITRIERISMNCAVCDQDGTISEAIINCSVCGEPLCSSHVNMSLQLCALCQYGGNLDIPTHDFPYVSTDTGDMDLEQDFEGDESDYYH